MLNTVAQQLSQIVDGWVKAALRAILMPLADRYSSRCLTPAGLVINAGGAAFAKTGANVTHVAVQGRLVAIAAATAMPALTGLNITTNYFNVACFFVDIAGNLTMVYGREASTRVGVKFPEFPAKKSLIGFLIITHSSAFTGGTTPLDTATTQYVDVTGPFDPNMLLG